MVTIQIRSWGDFIGGSVWDAHPEPEMKRRIRNGLKVSRHELRTLTEKICARETVTLHHVREEAVLGIIQILRVMGADTVVEMENFNDSRLFKQWLDGEQAA
jgi:hypothetical protein